MKKKLTILGQELFKTPEKNSKIPGLEVIEKLFWKRVRFLDRINFFLENSLKISKFEEHLKISTILRQKILYQYLLQIQGPLPGNPCIF